MTKEKAKQRALKRYEQLVNSNCKLRRNIHDAQWKLSHNLDEMNVLREVIRNE